ncbi:hypothetical protein G6F68_019485 [Rhizopus microsporus]|nr:hypothetical protein G6F68_019485 [Rhizopus microsporus]
MGIQPPYFQQQQPYVQPQISNVGYNAYGKDSVSQVTSQFGSMNMGPVAHTVSPAVPLLGARPQIADIENTGPQINLPSNVSEKGESRISGL